MSDMQNITRVDRYSVAEDLALEAIVAMERAWGRAHRDGELEPDEWGQGPSRVRLADLGLDARLLDHVLLGACPQHSEFSLQWTGLVDETPPDFARCSVTNAGERCPLTGPVRRSRAKGLPR